MPSRSLLLAVLSAAVFLVAGCGGDDADQRPATTYEVNGRFLGTASDGRDAVVHHEAIPDVMPPMVMALPLADTVTVDAVDKDDPVRVVLSIRGSTITIASLTPLPDTTTLSLDPPADTANTDPAEADTLQQTPSE